MLRDSPHRSLRPPIWAPITVCALCGLVAASPASRCAPTAVTPADPNRGARLSGPEVSRSIGLEFPSAFDLDERPCGRILRSRHWLPCLGRSRRPRACRRSQDQDKTANSCCFNLSMILIGLRARRVQVAEAHLPDLRKFETPSPPVGANYEERSSSQCPCSPA
jgi:hypothetical protein